MFAVASDATLIFNEYASIGEVNLILRISKSSSSSRAHCYLLPLQVSARSGSDMSENISIKWLHLGTVLLVVDSLNDSILLSSGLSQSRPAINPQELRLLFSPCVVFERILEGQ